MYIVSSDVYQSINHLSVKPQIDLTKFIFCLVPISSAVSFTQADFFGLDSSDVSNFSNLVSLLIILSRFYS